MHVLVLGSGQLARMMSLAGAPLNIRISALDVDTLTLSETTVAYLKARYSKLHDREKVVSILMDEVNSQVSVQYVSGKFFGIENGQFTKTLLSVMLKSIGGKYRPSK